MSKNIILLVAGQRTGSTSLNRAFQNSGQITPFYEVFLNDSFHRSQETNFFNWYGKNFNASGSVRIDSFLLESFLVHLATLCPTPTMALDIKYSQFRNFGDSAETATYLLKQFAASNDSVVVHLVRKNSFSRFLSYLLMKEKETHFYESGERVQIDKKIYVSPKRTEFNFNEYAENVKITHAQFGSMSTYLYYEYETLFKDDKISGEFTTNLGKLLGLKINALHTNYIKTPVDYSQIVKNKAELMRYFSGSSYEYQIREVLRIK